ncbi:MAG: hypothetical protein F6K26_49565 [Moorea sp. SIO2I5]|nr:hypothetical protein [Moorena sp. SIO2I5]
MTSGVGCGVWGVGCGGTDKRCSKGTGGNPLFPCCIAKNHHCLDGTAVVSPTRALLLDNISPTRALDKDNKSTYSPKCKKPTPHTLPPTPHTPRLTSLLKTYSYELYHQ